MTEYKPKTKKLYVHCAECRKKVNARQNKRNIRLREQNLRLFCSTAKSQATDPNIKTYRYLCKPCAENYKEQRRIK